jgi:phospholipase C
VAVSYDTGAGGAISFNLTNPAGGTLEVSILDVYTGGTLSRLINGAQEVQQRFPLENFWGWYDLIITVPSDPTFSYRFAGHVETGEDSFSDPVIGGLLARNA